MASGDKCANHNHDYSMNGCGNTTSKIINNIKHINNEAGKIGWKYKNKRWFCKNCWKEQFNS